MNTYNYTSIAPSESGIGGQSITISFTVEASDEFGNTASENVTGVGGLPPPTDIAEGETIPPYTDAELEQICKAIAVEKNVFTHLDTKLSVQRTPTYTPPPPPAPMTDDEKKTVWMAQIDTNVAAVYSQFTRFQMEYEQREKAAIAYKAAGYTGDPTIWLSAFADSNGISYKMCADLVLSQSDQLRGAVTRLGEYRMNKYKVKNAATIEEAETEFNTIVANIAALARSL